MLYKMACSILRLYLKIFNSWTVTGKENIPREGSVVLVGNHVSLWVPVVFACSVERTVNFMAKEELFKNPILSKLFRAFHAFPIKRGRPDRNALRIAAERLKEGKVLGLFPEGTRSKTELLLPLFPGAALFALRSNAPIVPIALIGTRTTFPLSLRGKIRVVIGKPLIYQDLYEQKITSEDLDKVTSDIMKEITQLLKNGEKEGTSK